jgi:hypothetical protein
MVQLEECSLENELVEVSLNMPSSQMRIIEVHKINGKPGAKSSHKGARCSRNVSNRVTYRWSCDQMKCCTLEEWFTCEEIGKEHCSNKIMSEKI